MRKPPRKHKKLRKSPNFADKDLHVSNPNSGTPHVNRRSRIGKSFIYKVVQKSMWTLYTFALISVWSCQKIPKMQDLSVLIHAFSVLLLKRYCFTNFVFTSPPKLFISWNIEADWVTRTWNFMDFCELRRDTTGAWSAFRCVHLL